MTRTCPVLLSDYDPLSTRELASFLPAFRTIYAISNKYFGNASEEEILRNPGNYMPKVMDICSKLTFEEALSSFGDADLGENELRIVSIQKSSPTKAVLLGVGPALTIATFFCGGKVKADFSAVGGAIEFKLPPLGDGVITINDAFKQP